MDNSAQNNRPHFGVEEIPSTPVVSEVPPTIDLTVPTSSAETPSEPIAVESLPPIPHTEFDRPPEPEHLPQTQFAVAASPTSGPLPLTTPAVSQSNLPPSGHNVMGKPHPAKKLLFLIPAVLLVATIYFVAKFTGRDFTMRELPPVVTPPPIEAPEVSSTPTPVVKKTKSYKNEALLLEMTIPEDYEVAYEGNESVSFERDGSEVLVVRSDEFTNYDEEDQTLDVLIGGRQAVELNLADEGSVPMRIVQTKEEPKYEFVMFLENSVLSVEFQEILDSVVFLVDTSDWETFENSTFNYRIKYPPQWDENTVVDDEEFSAKTEISKDPNDKSINNLVIQTSSNLENAALTASEIVSSTRTLSGWTKPPKIELKKLGGGDAQVIQGELSGKWRAYVVIWYKNSVVQMTWDDVPSRPEQQIFENMLSSFEFTT